MRTIKEERSLGGMSPLEYETKLSAAIDKYGEVALAFNPESGEFEPGKQMLPTAEVEGKFIPGTKEEADAYRNLGAQGGFEMRDMQSGITSDRNQFAQEYMYPVLDAMLNASSVGKVGQIAMKTGKLLKGSGPALNKLLAKQIASKSSQLAGKKKGQAMMSSKTY